MILIYLQSDLSNEILIPYVFWMPSNTHISEYNAITLIAFVSVIFSRSERSSPRICSACVIAVPIIFARSLLVDKLLVIESKSINDPILLSLITLSLKSSGFDSPSKSITPKISFALSKLFLLNFFISYSFQSSHNFSDMVIIILSSKAIFKCA